MENLPTLLGKAISEEIKNNFINQGTTTDDGLQKWVVSKAAQKEGRKTLIKSASLMNSVGYEARAGSVSIGINTSLVPYGPYHNEGMPPQIKRQFITLRKSTVDRVIRETLERNVR